MFEPSATTIFHDDGRICLAYRTSNCWHLRSITVVNNVKDHFFFFNNDDNRIDQVATSTDFTVIRFWSSSDALVLMSDDLIKCVTVLASHANNTLKFEDSDGNEFLVHLISQVGLGYGRLGYVWLG